MPQRPPSERRPAATLGMAWLRVAALVMGLVVVLSAQNRLAEPEIQVALARALQLDDVTHTSAEPAAAPVISDDLLALIDDDAPFRDAERDAWFALWRRVLDPGSDASRAPLVGYSQLVSQPDVYRARGVRVRGTVHRVEAVAAAPNDLGLTQLHRCIVQAEGGGVWPITVYTSVAPEREPPFETDLRGYFFKRLSYQYEGGVGTTPVIVAKSLVAKSLATALADERPAGAPIIESAPAIDFNATGAAGPLGHALLDRLGFDVASLDAVADRTRLTTAENPPFYALLDAVGQTPATQLARLARASLPAFVDRAEGAAGESARAGQIAAAVHRRADEGAFSVAPLFEPQHTLRGELLVFDAVVRRVLRVEADADAAVDHYYELTAFPEDSQNLPLVFCLRELPAGFPVGESVRQPARLAGFFFKQWVYRTRRVEGPKDKRQFAPLLIGRAPIPLAVEAAEERSGWIVGAGGLGLLAIAGGGVWWAAQSDRRYERSTLARFRRLAAEPTDVNRADRTEGGD